MKYLMSISMICSALITWTASADTWQGQGIANFSVKATGHSVHGEVNLKPFDVTAVKAGEDTLLSWKNEVEILKMDTHKKKRDEEMHHVLHADSHPLIRGEAAGLSLTALKAASEEANTFPIQFSLAGKEINKEVTVLKCEERPEGIFLQVAFDVSQLEHGLKPIRKMGFLKVNDTVHVEVQFTLAP